MTTIAVPAMYAVRSDPATPIKPTSASHVAIMSALTRKKTAAITPMAVSFLALKIIVTPRFLLQV
ncbi:MAG: hypothetical protein ABII12_06620 [Planctomycetota bacterium]